jgi:hypothetical protein
MRDFGDRPRVPGQIGLERRYGIRQAAPPAPDDGSEI